MTFPKESFITDENGNKIGILLPIKNYNKILEELEELEDIKAYDKTMHRKKEFIPLEAALKEIEAARKKKK